MSDKPYKTFEEQVIYLREHHGLIINDSARAIEIIKTVSYYDLVNGYKEHFMNDDKYDGKTSLEHLYLYLILDRSFQSVLHKYSIYVENYFRNILANNIAKHFGTNHNYYLLDNHYIIPSNPKRRKKFYKTLHDIQNISVPGEGKTIPNPTKYYCDLNREIPPWILFKNVTFSSLIDLYSFLPKQMQLEIYDYLIALNLSEENKINTCRSALTLIRMYRNSIVHDLKFIKVADTKFRLPIKSLHKTDFKELITKKDIENRIGTNDHYSMILSLVMFLNDSTLLQNFIADLYLLYGRYGQDQQALDMKHEYLDNLHIPRDFESRLKRYRSLKTNK